MFTEILWDISVLLENKNSPSPFTE
jgi:hypothetical protein